MSAVGYDLAPLAHVPCLGGRTWAKLSFDWLFLDYGETVGLAHGDVERGLGVDVYGRR